MKRKLGTRLQNWKFLAWAGLLTLSAGRLFAQLQAPNVGPSDHLDAVAITITRFGPNPSSITRPQGPFLLFLVNRSGALDDTYSLVRTPPKSEAGLGASGVAQGAPASLLDMHSTHKNQRDHQLIEPLPGNYQLRFLSHPDWVVNIIITAK